MHYRSRVALTIFFGLFLLALLGIFSVVPLRRGYTPQYKSPKSVASIEQFSLGNRPQYVLMMASEAQYSMNASVRAASNRRMARFAPEKMSADRWQSPAELMPRLMQMRKLFGESVWCDRKMGSRFELPQKNIL
jgi:hypothetical protein